MKVYIGEYFVNNAWGMRSPDNRLEFQKSFVESSFASALVTAKRLISGGYEIYKRKKDGKMITVISTQSSQVCIRREII